MTRAQTDALWATVPRLLAEIDYCVLATADEHGTPWSTPVYFAAVDARELFWVSGAGSRHSRNIAARPRVAVTVFDSRAAVGAAEAVYLTADAAVCDDGDLVLRALNDRLPPAKALETADLAPAGPLTGYRAVILEHHVLVRGGNPVFGTIIDRRYEVHRPTTREAS